MPGWDRGHTPGYQPAIHPRKKSVVHSSIAARAPFGLLWICGVALRLTVLSVPPVISMIQQDLNLSGTEIGLLSGLPVVIFAIFAAPGSIFTSVFFGRSSAAILSGMFSHRQVERLPQVVAGAGESASAIVAGEMPATDQPAVTQVIPEIAATVAPHPERDRDALGGGRTTFELASQVSRRRPGGYGL